MTAQSRLLANGVVFSKKVSFVTEYFLRPDGLAYITHEDAVM
jgi:hypothetical protein